jgi:hypothetical protein
MILKNAEVDGDMSADCITNRNVTQYELMA